MKVLHLNRSDISGGAARAVYRIHHALLEYGLDSKMWVNHSSSGDWTVDIPLSSIDKAIVRINPHLARLFVKSLKTKNKILHSPAVLPSPWVKYINQSDFDLVHLHWIGGEMLSISDFKHINKPMIWTLHDMWAFCGAEHVSFDERWRAGYNITNRPEHESGFDLNRWTWERKNKHWDHPFQIVTPSRWLGQSVRESALMANWPIRVIPNCLDTEMWKPMDRNIARELLNLPKDIPLLLFGANGAGASSSFHKGFDLLLSALKYLEGRIDDLELVIFGQHKPRELPDLGFPIRYVGYLYDDLSLRALYSAVNALVIPSRRDNLPNTGLEAQACGTPVIAFNIDGLKDIVLHKETGYLANPFCVNDLADGVDWTLDKDLRSSCCERIKLFFSSAKVAEQYVDCYANI